MRFEKNKSELPIGLASKLEANKETRPALKVKNEVVWVNPDLDLPFDLEVGKPTDLGLFLSSQETNSTEKRLEVEAHHNRSALLGRVLFGEKRKEGKNHQQIFRDIDIKGTGWVTASKKVEEVGMFIKDQSYGILTALAANHDMAFSETLCELGVRTHRVVAVIKLEEIVYEGKPIPVSQAKEEGLIVASSEPVLEIRAFGTHARLKDITSEDNPQRKKDLMIEDARLLVAQELGQNPKEFDRRKYAEWLVKTLGKNLAIMYKHGYIHKYLQEGHNITLDGCLVDFDSIEKIDIKDPEGLRRGDLQSTLVTLATFLTDGMGYERDEATEILSGLRNTYLDYLNVDVIW